MHKIYTKKGDKGDTCLYNGKVIKKDNKIIDLIGDLDELNCNIGLIKWTNINENIQIWIFDMGTCVANPSKKYKYDIDNKYISELENEIDYMTSEMPTLKKFILPSGQIHLARSVCRRCERKLCSLLNETTFNYIDPNCLVFLNRLSDYLFTLARYDSFINFSKEIYYEKSDILTDTAAT